MKRTMIVMFALALLLAWGGSAMAQPLQALHEAAEDTRAGCLNAAGDAIFNADNPAVGNMLALFPYFPKKDSNWWNGIVIGNSSEMATIARNTLCFVGVTAAGDGVAAMYGSPIYPQNTKAFLKETLAGDNWEESVYVGVYAANRDNMNQNDFFGFGLMGSKNEAGAVGAPFLGVWPGESVNEPASQPQAAFAFQGPVGQVGNGTDWNCPDGTDALFFHYLPGQGSWYSAIVLVNPGENDVEFVVTVVQDGTPKAVSVELEAGNMMVLTPAGLNEIADDDDDPVKWDASKTAYVMIDQLDDGDDATGQLIGWGHIGTPTSAVGYYAGQTCGEAAAD